VVVIGQGFESYHKADRGRLSSGSEKTTCAKTPSGHPYQHNSALEPHPNIGFFKIKFDINFSVRSFRAALNFFKKGAVTAILHLPPRK